jgi:hypothetical protein
MIPMVDLRRQYLQLKEEIDAAVLGVLDSTQFILGPNVSALEAEVARYHGVPHAIGVANGTDALLLALRALGIGAGDEVITTPFTFIATAEVAGLLGAVPVFVDVDPDTFNIDPALIEKAVTKRTKALIPVHLFGQPCDMDPILAVAKRHGLKVIEDCAQAFGARYKGKIVGTLGDAACFSFFPSKNLACYGDGGMVITAMPQRTPPCGCCATTAAPSGIITTCWATTAASTRSRRPSSASSSSASTPSTRVGGGPPNSTGSTSGEATSPCLPKRKAAIMSGTSSPSSQTAGISSRMSSCGQTSPAPSTTRSLSTGRKSSGTARAVTGFSR